MFYLLLFQLVGTENLKPVGPFFGTQSLSGAFQLLKDFLNWDFFLLFVRGNMSA